MKNQKDKTKTIVGAGILTAILASLCCITPTLSVLAGISGIATTFNFLEPFRPLLSGLSIVLIGYLWYRIYKNSQMECACNSFWESKKAVTMITVVVFLLITFPYYSPIFLGHKVDSSVLLARDKTEKTYTLHIDGMTCTGCEAAIESSVKKLPGIIEIRTNHKTGKGLVRFDANKTNINQIKRAIEELGYKVVNYEEI